MSTSVFFHWHFTKKLSAHYRACSLQLCVSTIKLKLILHSYIHLYKSVYNWSVHTYTYIYIPRYICVGERANLAQLANLTSLFFSIPREATSMQALFLKSIEEEKEIARETNIAAGCVRAFAWMHTIGGISYIHIYIYPYICVCTYFYARIECHKAIASIPYTAVMYSLKSNTVGCISKCQ